MMKILYLSCHKQLSSHEVGMLRELGYTVTEIGFETIPSLEENSGVQYIQPGLVQNAGIINLTKEYLAQFELIITCYYPRNLKWICANYQGKIVLRTIDSVHGRLETLYKEAHDSRSFACVRMNERELDFSKIPVIGIIRETVDEDIFSGWLGTATNVFTAGKGFHSRWDVDFDIYNRVTSGFNRTIPDGETTHNDMITAMRDAKINYVHPRKDACMTYTFAESMVMGMPTVCLGRRWLGQYWMGQNYITNGTNGFWTDNIDEARFIIKRLGEMDVDKLKGISYNARETGIKLFGKKGNTELWKQILE